MKNLRALGWLPVLLLIAACERSASTLPTSTPEPSPVIPSVTATEELTDPNITLVPPTQSVTPVPPDDGSPTPLATADPSATAQATNTPAASPSATGTPTGPAIDPGELYGDPAFVDNMTNASNWRGENNLLPDTENIRLELRGDQLYVTGKKLGFETWWFSWPIITDVYIEMEVRTDSCTGKDAYGLIARGPLRGALSTYGYIVAFSCDGSYTVRRLDSSTPYSATELIPWTQSNAIKAGANQVNIVGLRMDGSTLTILANRFEVNQLTDSSFRSGRYGIYVRPSQTANFTYRISEIRYWELPIE